MTESKVLPKIPDNDVVREYAEKKVLKKYSELGKLIGTCYTEGDALVEEHLEITDRNELVAKKHNGFSVALPKVFGGDRIIYERRDEAGNNSEVLARHNVPSDYEVILMLDTDFSPLDDGLMVVSDILNDDQLKGLEEYFQSVLTRQKTRENLKKGTQKTLI